MRNGEGKEDPIRRRLARRRCNTLQCNVQNQKPANRFTCALELESVRVKSSVENQIANLRAETSSLRGKDHCEQQCIRARCVTTALIWSSSWKTTSRRTILFVNLAIESSASTVLYGSTISIRRTITTAESANVTSSQQLRCEDIRRHTSLEI